MQIKVVPCTLQMSTGMKNYVIQGVSKKTEQIGNRSFCKAVQIG